MELLTFIICFMASVVGAICGIGGGVIIKPLLDSFGLFSVATISFLSGCTVLSMTTYSAVKGWISNETNYERKKGITLSVGAALGGIVGKGLFDIIKNASSNPDKVGAVQATCLLLVTVMTLVYTIRKEKIMTHNIEDIASCIMIGLILGLLSAFLGIGGGPINLVVLFYFFSMDTKTAAETSLYIIFFSQVASLFSSILTRKVPDFSIYYLLIMVLGGIMGGIFGRRINKKIANETVDKLFIALMIIIIFINIFNIYKFGVQTII